MYCAGNEDNDLIRGVYDGNLNGSLEQPCSPIVASTMADHVGMVVFLLGEGVDPTPLLLPTSHAQRRMRLLGHGPCI